MPIIARSHIPSFFRRLSTRVLSLVLFFVVAQTQVYGAYNQGTYGSGIYNGSATPTPTSTSSSSSSTSNTLGASDSKPPSCSEQPPGSAPDLFQIDRVSRSAQLFFAPAVQPYNKYIIAYGVDDRTEQFGVQFDMSHTSGVIEFTINELEPDTTYSFKVQAGNGCATGEWSNVLKAGANRNTEMSYFRVGGTSSNDTMTRSSSLSQVDKRLLATSPTAGANVTATPKTKPQPPPARRSPQGPIPQSPVDIWRWLLQLLR